MTPPPSLPPLDNMRLWPDPHSQIVVLQECIRKSALRKSMIEAHI